MKKAFILLLAVSSVALYAEDKAVLRAKGLANFINEKIENGMFSGYKKECIMQHGLYFSYRGVTYVADLKRFPCKEEMGMSHMYTSCIEIDAVTKTSRLCNCENDGSIKCAK